MSLALGSRIWRARWPIYCEVLFMALVDLVYEVMRALVAPGRQGVHASMVHARDISHLEATLGANIETSVQRITDAIAGGRFATTWYYTLAYSALFIGFLVGVWVWRRESYAFMRNWFITSQAIALMVFWLYPSAPPRLATGGLIDTTRHALTLGGALGWFQHLRNQYAAMPSLHIGLSFLYALALVWLCASWGRWRQIWWLLPLWMAWVTMATANHYLLDGIVGVLTVLMALAITHALTARDVPRPWQRYTPGVPAGPHDGTHASPGEGG